MCQIPHSRAATIKTMKRTLTELLDEKVRIVKERMNKTPFEALGITEEHYLRMKDTSKYTRLCEFLSCNGIPLPKRRNTIGNKRPYVEKFKWFLKCASKEDKSAILSMIDEIVSKDRERAQILEEIQLKKRQIRELEFRLK